jgi:hypothetical protein
MMKYETADMSSAQAKSVAQDKRKPPSFGTVQTIAGLGSTQLLREMSTTGISWGLKATGA